MPLNRTSLRLGVGLLAIVLASPALGLEEDPLGAQYFGTADVSTFGTPPPPNEGYFFSMEGLYWSVQRPNVDLIGAPGSSLVDTSVTTVTNPDGSTHPEIGTFPQTSSDRNNFINSEFQAGQRFELGRVENYNGWLLSIYRLQGNDQTFIGQPASVLFTDSFGLLFGKIGVFHEIVNTPSGLVDNGLTAVNGNLGTIFNSITVNNHIDTWGVELSYLRRTMTFHDGGNMEFYLGARYLEFNEDFNIAASGGTLDQTFWNTSAGNHIVGPQIGTRYFRKAGRWTVSAEGRFLAGLNVQNLTQEGTFGYFGNPGDLRRPLAWPGGAFENEAVVHEFSPVVELRLDAHYMVTRAINIRAGWTGIWMDGIARPSGMVEYQVPTMGLNTAANRQNLLMNGLTLGVEFNR
jgi:hypothetical protein